MCTQEITNPRKAIEHRKAQQEQYDAALKTCPFKQQHRRCYPARKASPPTTTHFVMKLPPPPSNNPEEKFGTPVSLTCTAPNPGRSASPKFVAPACPSPRSPPPETPKSCSANPTKPGSPGDSEESVCARRKAERVRRFAVGVAVGSLLLLLLYWHFRKAIARSLGLAEEDDDPDGAGGIFGSNAMSLYRRNRLSKRGQICWFNLPCQYDFEEDDWVVSQIGEHVRRYDKLHL
jgi:hypothetical protein